VGDFGGAGTLVPGLAGVFLIAGLASLALPGTAPFVSEFLVLIGVFTVHKTVAVVATLGIVLAAAYVLWMVQRTTHGTVNPEMASIRAMRKDLSLRESLVVAPLIALLVLFGFYPKPLLDVINPAIAATMDDLAVTDPAPDVARQEAGQ
jgi:NADH-quinone oxidoreductase subunit M